MEKMLLHGVLHVTIFEATQLFGSGACNIIHKVIEGVEKVVWKHSGKIYASVDIEGARVGRTRHVENDTNPQWYEQLHHLYVGHMADNVVFTLKQDEAIGATLLGRAYLPVTDIIGGEEVDVWLDILDENHKIIHKGSQVHVKVQFFDVTRDLNWNRGIKTPEFPGVPYTYFAQRNQCKVTLYQDAHVPDNFVPKIPLSNGKYYEPHRCWEDIFNAITDARHLIYITGWSVYSEITLIRDTRRPKPGGDLTLGELLKKKAMEGVRVLMLVWSNVPSDVLNKIFPSSKYSIVTHDKETFNYFYGTKVQCVLCPRNPDNGKNILEDLKTYGAFTHHQKTVVVDSALPNGNSDKRGIVSFVGGIDLCDGRYDTQFHSLFRTLSTVHHDDFYQANFEGASINKGGPREPWHDIHCKLEGPAAWDVLYNFEQRWKKEVNKDILLDPQEMSSIFLPPSPIHYPDDDDPETWNVQVFRSIEGGDAFGFPNSPEEAAKVGLISGKDSVIDRSIQDAYINAIRRAKKFIYIENQYFLGSSFDWKPTDITPADIGAINLIPKELSLKIVSKIEKGERFTAYVVLPMWPEGFPESSSVQAILDWQRRTMEMMYTDIIEALRAQGIEADPREYLTFFCLGNREVKKPGEYEPTESPDPDTDYSRAQEARRFMIYVHSKMMIVDDEYIIVGSANINERSMNGGRDSEIAMGAYQPYHIYNGEDPARGEIHGFRMSLWYEHLGMLDEVFLKPETVECVRKVNETAQKYWDLYTSESVENDLPGHLLRYPIRITEEGEVVEIPGFECFPDTNAKVLGDTVDAPIAIIVTT